MNSLDYRPNFRRNLPHIQPEGGSFFITFRLFGSIPKAVIEAWKLEDKVMEEEIGRFPTHEQNSKFHTYQKKQFARFDTYLDQHDEIRWLANSQIANLVSDSIHFLDGKKYRLDAFCIMSNHVHVVSTPLKKDDETYYSLSEINHGIKSFTATKANKILGRTGQPFWQYESYDHSIRDEGEFDRIIKYVLNNPVKAGLVDNWMTWKWSYSRFSAGKDAHFTENQS